MQSQPHVVKRLAPINHQLVRVLAEDLDRTRIHGARRRPVFLPLVYVAAIPVGIDLRAIGVGYDDCAVGPAERTPHDVRTGVGCGRVVDDNGTADRVAEFEGRVGHYVVDGVVDAVRRRVADGELVHENPFLEGRDEGDDSHAWARNVLVVGDVVDDGAPGLEVGGCLVSELLAVLGVALVGVVRD
jgi:hypothetical protein